MWISRKEYDTLIEKSNKYERIANNYSGIFESAKHYKDSIYIDFGCVITSHECFNEIIKKKALELDEIKDIKAELEWYKVKYHEMKNNIKLYNSGNQTSHDTAIEYPDIL